MSTQVVPGTANIFGAGRDAAPQPGGGGGGTLPPVVELPSGSRVVTSCATGEVTPFTGQPLRNGPAGDTQGAGGESTDVTSYEGISGIVNQGNGMFRADLPDRRWQGRSYRVPSGATRLFLGFTDAFLYEGSPGWYGNNAGELDVTVTVDAD